MGVRQSWQAGRSVHRLPPVLRSWLLEPGSLTARCQRASTTFRVRVLSMTGDLSLMAPHGRPARPRVISREVLLECDGTPVIFAHTELAPRPRGRLSRWLARLGSRSLGSLLFAHPAFRRGVIEVCRLRAGDALYVRACAAAGVQGCPTLWARRSRHHLAVQSVVVTEVFLPAIERLGKR